MPDLSETESPPAKIRKSSHEKRIVKENQNIPEIPPTKVRTKIVEGTKELKGAKKPKETKQLTETKELKRTKQPNETKDPKESKQPKKEGDQRKKSKQHVHSNPPATSCASTSNQLAEESATIPKPENSNSEMESVPSQNNSTNPPQSPKFEALPADKNNFHFRPVSDESLENILLYRAISPGFCVDPRQKKSKQNLPSNSSATSSASTSNQLAEELAANAKPKNNHNEMESVPSQNNPANPPQSPNVEVLPQDENDLHLRPVPNESMENVLLYRAISPEFCFDPREPAAGGSPPINPAEVSASAQRIYDRLVVELSNFALPFPNDPAEDVAEPQGDLIEEEQFEHNARPDEDMLQSIVDDVLQSLPKEELDTYASGVEKARQLLPKLRQRLYLVMRNVKGAIRKIGRSSDMHGRLPHSEHFNNSLKRLESVLSHIEIELKTVIECLRQRSLERGMSFLTQAAYIEAHEEKHNHVLDIRLKYGMHMKLAPCSSITVDLLKSASVYAKFITGAKLAVEFTNNMQRMLNENKIMSSNWDEY